MCRILNWKGEDSVCTERSKETELDRREWRMQNGDRDLHETGSQLQFQRMELYQANQLNDQNPKGKELVLQ